MQLRTPCSVIIGFILVLIVSGNAQAQPAEANNLHRHILKTKRGMSMEEALRFYQSDFQKLDTSDDGRIDEDEFMNMADMENMRKQLPADAEHQAVFRMFAQGLRDQLDLNRDGFISMQEYLEVSLPFARRLDADGDEFISLAEVETDWAKRQQAAQRWKAYADELDNKLQDVKSNLNDVDIPMEELERIRNKLHGIDQSR